MYSTGFAVPYLVIIYTTLFPHQVVACASGLRSEGQKLGTEIEFTYGGGRASLKISVASFSNLPV
jgi:hypothetical protein